MRIVRCCGLAVGMVWAGLCLSLSPAAAEGLRVGVFHSDASPEIGSMMAYDRCIEVTDPLSCRGVVILGSGEPIVLCAIDWIGVANEAHDELRQRLAEATGTTPERVSVHALHQHDAPRCDFTAAALLDHYGQEQLYDVRGARQAFERAAEAARSAVERAVPVDGLGLGVAEVEQVASNRRILGEDGKVAATRYTATRDPRLRAAPAGTVDPKLRMISFWNGDEAVAALSYFATHPQSYYRTGKANPDFPGYARDRRQSESGVPHIHFNGAGGNIGAGKWNDGSVEYREILTDRVARAMQAAWEATERSPLRPTDVGWESVSVELPVGEHVDESVLVARLSGQAKDNPELSLLTAAKHLAWLRRVQAGEKIEIGCLRLGTARVLHMPGELFVEYQLAAQQMRPELFVAMAAYGDYGPGYIGTAVAYDEGGYETSDRATRVSPAVEAVLLGAVEKLLRDRTGRP
ncbi:hypothetical protein [Candidatus Laterigemmans baculatus]|nr:hypothetical protein [Candidatus Laterigemmans baculatus]